MTVASKISPVVFGPRQHSNSVSRCTDTGNEKRLKKTIKEDEQ